MATPVEDDTGDDACGTFFSPKTLKTWPGGFQIQVPEPRTSTHSSCSVAQLLLTLCSGQ